MNDDWTEVGEITDGSGKKIVVAYAQGKVRFAVKAPVKGLHLTTIVLDGPARDKFMRLVAGAERQAEALDAAPVVTGGIEDMRAIPGWPGD